MTAADLLRLGKSEIVFSGYGVLPFGAWFAPVEQLHLLGQPEALAMLQRWQKGDANAALVLADWLEENGGQLLATTFRGKIAALPVRKDTGRYA